MTQHKEESNSFFIYSMRDGSGTVEPLSHLTNEFWFHLEVSSRVRLPIWYICPAQDINLNLELIGKAYASQKGIGNRSSQGMNY